MARRRLTAILASTVLATGALALPAVGAELPVETVTTEVPTETAEDAVAEVSATVRESLPVEDAPAETVEEAISEAATTLPVDPDGATDPLPVDPTTGDDGGDLPTGGTTTSSGGDTRQAPAPGRTGGSDHGDAHGGTISNPAPPRFDRGALNRVPSATASMTTQVAAPEVAAPEVAEPRVAPSGGEDEQVLAAPISASTGPVVPGALRAAAAALVLGAAVTWRRTWAEIGG